MTNFPERIRFSFSRWLPIAAVLLSAAIILVPVGRLYVRWRTAIGHNEKLMLTGGNITMILDRNRLMRTAIDITALNEQEPICILNAPGRSVAGLAFQTFAHCANWFPNSLGPFIWRALIFPLFAIPAWFFAGRGIDGLLLRRRMRRTDLILSAILVLLSVAISAGLRFGLSESERNDQFTVVSIYGFTLWSLLFALPLAGWVRQRDGRRISESTGASK